MSSTRFGRSPKGAEGMIAPPSKKVLSGKRAEDTGAGCRAKADADLVRAHAPGSDYMRQRLEQSAAVWAERASLLERLESGFERRTLGA
jgi:hypothetical protein